VIVGEIDCSQQLSIVPWSKMMAILSRKRATHGTTNDAGNFAVLYRQRHRSNHCFLLRKLGFETRFQQPDRDPFFAMVGRDGAQIFVKSDKGVSPLPNSKRHSFMRWDAYVYAPDSDALAAELADQRAAFSEPLKDTHDGLRGFEVCDPDGYVLFFGRPRHTAD
jgi:hypothetical protein